MHRNGGTFNILLISSDCKERLQGTGSVWEHCDRVVKLPCDNKSSVSRHCLTQLQLLRDAKSEIEEVLYLKICDCNGK